MEIHLLIICDRKDEANHWLELHLSKGYKYIPKILEQYNYYEMNRKKYKTFGDFYPTLLKVFENEI